MYSLCFDAVKTGICVFFWLTTNYRRGRVCLMCESLRYASHNTSHVSQGASHASHDHRFNVKNNQIINNYSLKSRFAARYIFCRYSPGLKSFSIYSLSDLNNTFCGLLCVFWYSMFLNFQYFRFTNGGQT